MILIGYADYPEQGITHRELDACLRLSYINPDPAFISLKKDDKYTRRI